MSALTYQLCFEIRSFVSLRKESNLCFLLVWKNSFHFLFLEFVMRKIQIGDRFYFKLLISWPDTRLLLMLVKSNWRVKHNRTCLHISQVKELCDIDSLLCILFGAFGHAVSRKCFMLMSYVPEIWYRHELWFGHAVVMIALLESNFLPSI